MLKMTIDNEEVVSDKDITINEEMLSASSTILNNVYPKEWEEDKDYTSKFYYPQDYSKALIQRSYVTQEAEAGTTIQVNGSVTLTDVDTTKNSRVLRLLGQTSQTGTPTPTNPIPVNVVSGNNEIKVCGKNLFKPYEHTDNNTGLTLEIVDGNAHLFGTATSNNSFRIMNDVVLNGTYTWSLEGNIGLWAWNRTTSSADVQISQNAKKVTKTYNGDNTIIMAFTPITGTTYDITFKPMLEKGSSASTYEPYQGNTYNIDLPVENLFNKSGNLMLDYRLANDGGNFRDIGYYISEYIPISANTTYTKNSPTADYAHRVCFFSNNDTTSFISKSEDNTFTTPSNAKYLRFCGLQTEIDTTQLEVGSKQNTYTPYGTTPIELCKIGNYQDYIYKDSDKWYLHKEIGKVVLNGSENWIKHGSIASWFYYDGIINGYVLDNKQILIKTNYYTPKAYQDVPNLVNGECSYGSSDSGITHRFVIKNTDYTQTNDFKNWLSTHNTIVYYALTTPTNTEITYQPLIDQLNALSSQ